MSNALDRALEDIIDGGSKDSSRSAGRPRQRVEQRRSSPYLRNNDGHRQQSQRADARDRIQARGSSSARGKWSHDLFDHPGDINDRLGSTPKHTASGGKPAISTINLRLGLGDKTVAAADPVRGISIAGLSRDTTPYDEFRVVWVSGVPASLTQEKIESVFGDVGRIDAVRMAIDGFGNFTGKVEIVYRLAEDARSAIQVFDGELLYGTDVSSRVEKMSITYSSTANADYIDALKYERRNDDSRRHGQASYRSNDRNQRNGRSRQSNNDGRSSATSGQLDADLDAYMSRS
ncbi:hypothetical protein IWW39_001412 [Coemansia spiralis]|uniref:RRM domain-containing protein n=1 Tax=Coemansia spiralis TaxID=417178 RepID=A0A9W8L681_9FUNG|nr:hypothetical protein IWW39_001412 [Coemansia spiralis]